MADLKTLRLQLALVQVGCLLASEGLNRVTSSELLFRAKKEQGIDASPSVVGQALGFLGIPSTTSKGKTRFQLDVEHLEPLLVDLSDAVQMIQARVDEVVIAAGNIEARLAPIQERFDQIHARLELERQMQ